MAWTIKFSDDARKHLKKLDRQSADRVTRYMYERVGTLSDPRRLGIGLVGNLEGYWRYRVGAYRVICELRDGELIVLIVAVAHRKEVYQ